MCKKIRAELRSIFEHEVISNIAVVIEARVVNFNFNSLFRWLDEHDQQLIPESKHWTPRELKIHVTCRPELSINPWQDGDSSRHPTSHATELLPHLLLKNLSATMNGWSWDNDTLRSTSCTFVTLDSQQLMQTFGVSDMFVHSRCRRERTGHHYKVAFISEDTWHHLSHATFPISKVAFYDHMFKTITCTRGLSSEDRKLALMLREVCQSDCSEVERDAVAGTLDMNLGHIRPGVVVELSTTQFWKWNFTIACRADKEESRMTRAMVEHYDFMEKLRDGPEYNAGDKRSQETVDRTTKRQRCTAVKPVWRNVFRAGLPAEPTSHREDAMSEIEEITRMMAKWHL